VAVIAENGEICQRWVRQNWIDIQSV
jgi:hypothetical protein